MHILVGGVGKAEVAQLLRTKAPGEFEVTVTNDMDAAIRLQAKEADFYLGSCHTGAGAALGVLVALLGTPQCQSFGRIVPETKTIETALAEGKVAFGFSIDHADIVVARFLDALRRT